VTCLDPAPAIARRVVELTGPPAARQDARSTQAVFTSGRAATPGLAAALARFGIGDITADPFDTPHLSA
jgi:glutamate racemase